MQIEIGKVIDGKVTGITNFGAFVEIEEGITGLVHISEVAHGFVKDINEHLKVGDSVKVKVIKIDEDGKISLSIKQAAPERKEKRKKEDKGEKKVIRPAEIDWGQKNEDMSFEDKLSKFKEDSNEAFRILKRNAASKRSGGYSRKGNYSF